MKISQRFTAWSPSRLDDYDKCPFAAAHKHLLKTCTLCFNGKIVGGYNCPAVCDTCGETIVKGEALVRGTDIGDQLDTYLTGKPLLDADDKPRAELKPYVKKPPAEIRHPKTLEIVKKAKAEVKKGTGVVQLNLMLTKEWKIWTGPGWAREVWLRAKLDYRRTAGAAAHVIDWKTGGIDKRTGAVRASEKYDDQLGLYNVATLSTLPQVEGVTSALVFLDCGPRFDPCVERDGLARKDLTKAQAHFTKKALPMFVDDSFAPKANGVCRWCDYRKERGGPCPY